jgi:DNA-binding beta-propeller fold protein YncE
MAFDPTRRVLFISEAQSGRIVRFGVPLDSSANLISLPPFGSGVLSLPMGLAISRTGTLLVADMNNHRIVEFSGDGVLLRTYGTPGSGDGQMLYPFGVAEDSRNGNLYVTDTGNRRVVSFTRNGSFRAAFRTWTNLDRTPVEVLVPAGIAINRSGVMALSVNRYSVALVQLRE